MTAFFDTLGTPIGEVLVAVDETGEVLCVRFLSGGGFATAASRLGYFRRDPERAGAARCQLAEYFAGQRREFDLSLRGEGTPFQQAVWRAIRTVPYGHTTTYRQIAAQLEQPSACRAVGAASHANPMPILVPCHRVVGSHGDLVGFGAGLSVKRFLLRLEGISVPEQGELDL